LNRYALILIFCPLFLKCSSQETAPSKQAFLAIVRTADSLHFHHETNNGDSTCPYSTTDSLAIRRHLSQPIGWTSDYECLFTSGEIAYLDSMLRTFEKETKIEIAVVTFDSSWKSNKSLEDFVVGLHNVWGVGKKGYNNGILFGFSANWRKIRISNGFGLEGVLSDLLTKKIIDEVIIPEFKTSSYFEGTKKGLLAIISNFGSHISAFGIQFQQVHQF
jgi:uncharacterized protein